MRRASVVWTKAERTKALASIFKEAGFTRKGADWVLERNDLRWLTFLSIVRKPEGDEYDLVSALYRIPSQVGDPEGDLIGQFGLGDLLGVDWWESYSGTVQAEEDPLIRDVREHLIPVVERFTTVLDAVRAVVDGELVVFARCHDYPIAKAMFGWLVARRLGLDDEVRRAERIIAKTDWDRASRKYYREAANEGGDLAVGVELMPSANQSWRDRFRLNR